MEIDGSILKVPSKLPSTSMEASIYFCRLPSTVLPWKHNFIYFFYGMLPSTSIYLCPSTCPIYFHGSWVYGSFCGSCNELFPYSYFHLIPYRISRTSSASYHHVHVIFNYLLGSKSFFHEVFAEVVETFMEIVKASGK